MYIHTNQTKFICMKKYLVIMAMLILVSVTSYAGDVRISAKSTLAAPAPPAPSLWDRFVSWVESI